jgi:hypothetical protein
MILMVFLRLIGASFSLWRGRSGKLLIFLLTPRGFRRLRLETTLSWRISSSTRLWKAFLSRGGNSAEDGQFAANDAHRVQEG